MSDALTTNEEEGRDQFSSTSKYLLPNGPKC